MWGLALIAIPLAGFGAMAGAAGKGKKKAKVVTISGKLQSELGTNAYVDQASSISMKVIVKRGEPQKIKNVLVTFSYECSDQPPRTGVATFAFPEPIDVDFEPGSSPDRVDFEWQPPSGGTGLFGDVTRKGRSAFGQVFVGLENDFCANNLAYFRAQK